MPAGGGDPKKLGDGLVVKLRPEYSRGGSDLWDTRDAMVAICEELDKLYVASQLVDFAAFKAALAVGRTSIKIVDGTDSEA